LRQGLGILVALEIPHQQDKEEYDSEHKDAEVVASGSGAAPGEGCHSFLDAILSLGFVPIHET
jgi:hypothetical protein